jgi:hypothetical protein
MQDVPSALPPPPPSPIPASSFALPLSPASSAVAASSGKAAARRPVTSPAAVSTPPLLPRSARPPLSPSPSPPFGLASSLVPMSAGGKHRPSSRASPSPSAAASFASTAAASTSQGRALTVAAVLRRSASRSQSRHGGGGRSSSSSRGAGSPSRSASASSRFRSSSRGRRSPSILSGDGVAAVERRLAAAEMGGPFSAAFRPSFPRANLLAALPNGAVLWPASYTHAGRGAGAGERGIVIAAAMGQAVLDAGGVKGPRGPSSSSSSSSPSAGTRITLLPLVCPSYVPQPSRATGGAPPRGRTAAAAAEGRVPWSFLAGGACVRPSHDGRKLVVVSGSGVLVVWLPTAVTGSDADALLRMSGAGLSPAELTAHAVFVDAGLSLGGCPAVDARWHPLGAAAAAAAGAREGEGNEYLVLLTADGLTTLEVGPAAGSVAVSDVLPWPREALRSPPVAFDFGCGARAADAVAVSSPTAGAADWPWDPLTVLVACEDATLYALCPYLPRGMALPAHYHARLIAAVDAGGEDGTATRAWLSTRFVSASSSSSSTTTVLHHAGYPPFASHMESWLTATAGLAPRSVPALQGPFETLPSLTPRPPTGGRGWRAPVPAPAPKGSSAHPLHDRGVPPEVPVVVACDLRVVPPHSSGPRRARTGPVAAQVLLSDGRIACLYASGTLRPAWRVRTDGPHRTQQQPLSASPSPSAPAPSPRVTFLVMDAIDLHLPPTQGPPSADRILDSAASLPLHRGGPPLERRSWPSLVDIAPAGWGIDDGPVALTVITAGARVFALSDSWAALASAWVEAACAPPPAGPVPPGESAAAATRPRLFVEVKYDADGNAGLDSGFAQPDENGARRSGPVCVVGGVAPLLSRRGPDGPDGGSLAGIVVASLSFAVGHDPVSLLTYPVRTVETVPGIVEAPDEDLGGGTDDEEDEENRDEEGEGRGGKGDHRLALRPSAKKPFPLPSLRTASWGASLTAVCTPTLYAASPEAVAPGLPFDWRANVGPEVERTARHVSAATEGPLESVEADILEVKKHAGNAFVGRGKFEAARDAVYAIVAGRLAPSLVSAGQLTAAANRPATEVRRRQVDLREALDDTERVRAGAEEAASGLETGVAALRARTEAARAVSSRLAARIDAAHLALQMLLSPAATLSRAEGQAYAELARIERAVGTAEEARRRGEERAVAAAEARRQGVPRSWVLRKDQAADSTLAARVLALQEESGQGQGARGRGGVGAGAEGVEEGVEEALAALLEDAHEVAAEAAELQHALVGPRRALAVWGSWAAVPPTVYI